LKEGLGDITLTYRAGSFLSREIPAIVEQLTRHVDAGIEMRSHLDIGTSFAFETTLAGRGYLPLIRESRGKHGYHIRLFFLSLQRP
jgi:predicted ABC-type ATPase